MSIPRNNHHVSLVVQKQLMHVAFPNFQFFKKRELLAWKIETDTTIARIPN